MTEALDLTFDIFGGVLSGVISEIPVANIVLVPVFTILWSKLKTASPKEDVTAKLAGMISDVKQYIDKQIDYAKEQISIDSVAMFTSLANDLKVQEEDIPDSAPIVISTHQKCVEKARDALHVLFDLEMSHITIHHYAAMASLYITLLDDGIRDRANWGISSTLKKTYADRLSRFFQANEFSQMIASSMKKSGQGKVPLRRLLIKTTQLTNFWYSFNPRVYPNGVPELVGPLKPGDALLNNHTSHVYLQPSTEEKKCVVNNMPGGYVRQVSTSRQESHTWHPYYKGHDGSILRLASPAGAYPQTVHVRYYRLAEVVATKFIGLDHELRVTLSPGGAVQVPIPGEGKWGHGEVIFESEAVVLAAMPKAFDNFFVRGQGDGARLEYVELGTLTLAAPADVSVHWKPTARQARSFVLLSAVELMLSDA